MCVTKQHWLRALPLITDFSYNPCSHIALFQWAISLYRTSNSASLLPIHGFSSSL